LCKEIFVYLCQQCLDVKSLAGLQNVLKRELEGVLSLIGEIQTL